MCNVDGFINALFHMNHESATIASVNCPGECMDSKRAFNCDRSYKTCLAV